MIDRTHQTGDRLAALLIASVLVAVSLIALLATVAIPTLTMAVAPSRIRVTEDDPSRSREGQAAAVESAGEAGLVATPHPAVATPQPHSRTGFEFIPDGQDERGWLRYTVRITRGGSPYLVATEMLTPLFDVDGVDAPTYVANAFFRDNPHRRPNTIQPGDEFSLVLPPTTFIVDSQYEVVEHFGGPARVRVYVSERGDLLRYYLSDPFPVLYEMRPAGSTHGTIALHPDLAFQLRTGRTDVFRLAQLLYLVPDPDIFQMEATRSLVGRILAGEKVSPQVDRTRRYLDPVREAMDHAVATEPVPESERAHLIRLLFDSPDGAPFAAVEDGLGTITDLSLLPGGQVFRIIYHWDGTVQIFYKTGQDDAMGKRNPYQHRENERWASLYQRLSTSGDWPIRWGRGEPDDLAPFPSARDPRTRAPDTERAFDYLIPGRVLVLTFRPTRSYAETQADNAVISAFLETRARFREQIETAFQFIERIGLGDLPALRRAASGSRDPS